MTAGTLVNAKIIRIETPGIIKYETLYKIVKELDEVLGEVEEEFNVT